MREDRAILVKKLEFGHSNNGFVVRSSRFRGHFRGGQNDKNLVLFRDQKLWKNTSKFPILPLLLSPPLPLPSPSSSSPPRRRNPTRSQTLAAAATAAAAVGMYADRTSGRKRSVRDRLGSGGVSRSRSDDAKRFRRDDGTWRRELYKDSGVTQTSSGPTSRNLESNQKSHVKQRIEVVKKSSVPDLREKLSGIPSQRPQLSSTVRVPKPVREVVNSDEPVQKRDPPPAVGPPVIKKVSAPAPAPAPAPLPAPPAPTPKQSQEKVDSSLESLLKSLDLEKYLINFQAEEVDMKALVYMNEEDMKALGIPMGPRKKILSAMAHKKRKSSKSLPTS